MKKFGLVFLGSALSIAYAVILESIELVGAQRYSEKTILTYAAVEAGDELHQEDIPQIIKNLYMTNFFDDIRVRLDEQARKLCIEVTEKDILGDFVFEGYAHFSKNDLEKYLTEFKIQIGRPLNLRQLELMVKEIRKMYAAEGYYNAQLDYNIELDRQNHSLVCVMKIQEGPIAKIQYINLHGNYAFPVHVLKKIMRLQSSNLLTLITSADKYSDYKLEQDIIALEQFYHNNGYPDMKVVDKRVLLSESQAMTVDLFIEEGSFALLTDFEIDAPIAIEIPDYDSLALPMNWNADECNRFEAIIRDKLNFEGYVYGDIRQERIRQEDNTVKIIYRVLPGQRFRVRDYKIHGNTITKTSIIRNFIKRPEGTLYSSADFKDLNEDLLRTGLFSNVQINPVGVDAQTLDMDIFVQEDKTKKIAGGMSLSNNIASMTMSWNLSYEDRNILGTGSKMVLKNESDNYESILQFSLSNPYITEDNVEVFFDYQRILRSYQNEYMFFKQDRDIYSTTLGSNWKIQDNLRFGLSTNYFIEKDKNQIQVQDNPGEDTWAHYVFISARLFKNLFNRYILPDRGYRWELFSQISLPIGDYTYTDSGLHFQYYYPIGKSGFIFYQHFMARFMFSYGETSKSIIPSTRLMSCGGSEEIRGYHFNSVGPKIETVDVEGDTIYQTVGGNIKSVLRSEIIIPNEMLKIDYDQLRISAFIDAAQLWRTVPVPDTYNQNGNTYIPAEGVNLTTGLCLRFVSPVLPPMTLSANYPLIYRQRDKTAYEYFSFGTQMNF